jgi:hypothetical protein
MENNGRGIFYGVIGVATLIVAIIGATFAYFSASATNDSDVTGTTASGASLAIAISKVSATDTEKNMIPMYAKDLQKGVTGVEEKGGSCKDANGNTVCEVFKITVTNGSKDIGINVKGTMTLASTAKNMKWQVLTDATSVNSSASTVAQGTEGTIIDNQALTASGTHDFYLVVWLEDTDEAQDADDAGKTFTGTVTFNGVNADGSSSTGITAKFKS